MPTPTRPMTHKRLATLGALLGIWSALTYACAVEEENPGNPRAQRGADSGADGALGPTGTEPPLGAPICGKYGGYDKVKTIADAIIARAEGDCRIGPAFTRVDANKKAHLSECFQIQLGGMFQCEGVSYTAGTTVDSKNQKCRSMQQAHQGMNLRKADFDAFMEAVATELTAQGLSMDDLRAIAPAFEGTRQQVTQTNNQPDKNTYCGCPNGEYMGKDCTPDLPEAGIDAAPDATQDAAADAPADVVDSG